MPIQAVLDEPSFNGLDESLKTLYVQNPESKQYFLDVDNGDALAFNLQKEAETLRNHNKTVLGEKKAIQEKVKAWESLGKSPEEIKQLLESNRPEEFSKILTDKDSEWKSKFDSLTEELNHEKTESKRYRERALNTELKVKIAQIKEQFDLNDTADFVLKNYLKVDEEEGQIVTKFYGEDGKPMHKAGYPVTEEQFLNGLKEQKKFLSMFNAPNGGGTNATNRQATAHGQKVLKRSEYDARILTEPHVIQQMLRDGYKLID